MIFCKGDFHHEADGPGDESAGEGEWRAAFNITRLSPVIPLSTPSEGDFPPSVPS